jgi:hypothetical protein
MFFSFGKLGAYGKKLSYSASASEILVNKKSRFQICLRKQAFIILLNFVTIRNL